MKEKQDQKGGFCENLSHSFFPLLSQTPSQFSELFTRVGLQAWDVGIWQIVVLRSACMGWWKRKGFVKIYLTISFLFSIKLPLNSQNSSPEWVYWRGTWAFGRSWCWDRCVWGGGDVADQCLMVALVAGFGIVVDCGLVMRSVSWWLLGLVHVFALSFNDC